MVGYIGANGAGKSTTIKMLTGILTPTGGEIRVGGLVPYKQRVAYTRHIGVVFGQRTQLWWDLAVVESLRLLQRIYEVPEAAYRERIAFFDELLDIGRLLHQPVRKLSLGERMRCDLAAALLHEPRVLVPRRADHRPRRGRQGEHPRLPALGARPARGDGHPHHARPRRHPAALPAPHHHRPRPRGLRRRPRPPAPAAPATRCACASICTSRPTPRTLAALTANAAGDLGARQRTRAPRRVQPPRGVVGRDHPPRGGLAWASRTSPSRSRTSRTWCGGSTARGSPWRRSVAEALVLDSPGAAAGAPRPGCT